VRRLAYTEKEFEMAVSLINSLTEPFRPEHYTDERRQDMPGAN